MTGHKVWTFVFRGGEPFDLTLPRTPRLSHDGGLTLWKMVGTERAAQAVEQFVQDAVSGVSVTLYTESESEEQRTERLSLLEGSLE